MGLVRMSPLLSGMKHIYFKHHLPYIRVRNIPVDTLNNLNHQSSVISQNCSMDERALHWVRWISGDYVKVERKNSES